MSYSCVCANGDIYTNVSRCSVCGLLCGPDQAYRCEETQILGVEYTTFLILMVLSLVLFLGILAYAVVVMRRCASTTDPYVNPPWLLPTVIILLILFLVVCWIPGLGFLMFVTLLCILLIYSSRCDASSSSLPSSTKATQRVASSS